MEIADLLSPDAVVSHLKAASKKQVLQEMARQGITDVCLTPHLPAGRSESGPPAAHQRAFDALRAQAPAAPRLHRGAEIMLDRPLTRPVALARNLTLGGSRYVLVEFPRLVAYDTVTNALTQVAELGLIPVLAHPERYSCCTPEAVTDSSPVRRFRRGFHNDHSTSALVELPQARIEIVRKFGSIARPNHPDCGRRVAGARA
jgi:hypothetical protein